MNEQFSTEELNQIEEQIRNDYDKNDISIITDGTVDIPKIDRRYSTKQANVRFVVGDIFGQSKNGSIEMVQMILRAFDTHLITTQLISDNTIAQTPKSAVSIINNRNDVFYLNDPLNVREKTNE